MIEVRLEGCRLPVAKVYGGAEMTTTLIVCLCLITAMVIEVDKLTQFKFKSLPAVAFLGVLAVVLSLVL